MAVAAPVFDTLGAKSISWRRHKSVDGIFPAAQCGCIRAQGKCIAMKSCMWIEAPVVPIAGAPLHARSKQCVPRGAAPAGFEGIAAYAGQKTTVPLIAQRRTGTRYVHVPGTTRAWRVPGPLNNIRALAAFAWP
jgi:hypothetical protein